MKYLTCGSADSLYKNSPPFCVNKTFLSSHLVFLSHAVNELHHFDEVLAAKRVVDGVSRQGSVLPVPPLGQGQLPGKRTRVTGTALHLGTTVAQHH